MKTAEEILKVCIDNEKYKTHLDSIVSESVAIEAINKARKEAIEECAEIFFNPENINSIELAKKLKSLIKELK